MFLSELTNKIIQDYKNYNIALAGGIFANVKLNQSQLTQSEINLVNKSLMAFMEVEQLLNSENSIETLKEIMEEIKWKV